MNKLLAALLLPLASPLYSPLYAATHATACPAEVRAKSGPYVVSIAELYTSEGCDSCPPADRWLSTLSGQASARQPVIPLAFHVDYWDYIGWRDPFAQPQWAERQRAIVQSAGKRTVYTPQVFLNGQDVGLWSNQRAFQQNVSAQGTKSATVELALAARVDGKQMHASVGVKSAPGVARSDLSLFLALTESNLTSSVKAGENRGVTLHHDHVVHRLIGPLAIDSGAVDNTLSIPLAPYWKRADLGVVAYVQTHRSGEVLQALSARLCEP